MNASMIRNAGQAGEEHWPSKVTAARLSAGDTLQITVPNSAGYGDPLERDPELVLSDVLDGYTTVELAERDYGVVIDGGSMTVDGEATAQLRKERIAVPLA
jgi:5-oxoprolinase (ATP-hydrolysing)